MTLEEAESAIGMPVSYFGKVGKLTEVRKIKEENMILGVLDNGIVVNIELLKRESK